MQCNSNKDSRKGRVVYIKSFGCQMNVRDSEVISGLLAREGYQITDKELSADIVIFVTCSVRQHAEDKVWSEIGRYKAGSLKLQGKRLGKRNNCCRKKLIGLVGCMAQNYKDEAFKMADNIDFVVGPADISKIPKIVNSLVKNSLFEHRVWETDNTSIRPDEIYHTGFYQDKEHAYVVIAEGCSNYCSYCVVPFVRGELKVRNYKNIVREIEEAADRGIKKITLLGQNVNAYYYENVDLVKLLQLVDQINGVEEISFITSHPRDTKIELFKVMSDLSKVKKNLHLPVQSGSDRILSMMNRGYTKNFYLDLVDNYRKIVPQGILSSDIIVGFPGETEKDFMDTYNLVKDVEFNSAYIFKYSIRPHTKAESLDDDVHKNEKERRHQLILNLQKDTSKRIKAHE